MGFREVGQSDSAARGITEDRRPPRSSVVATRNFLLATRDSGYRSTAAAVAEFVDNSIQAGAQAVHVHVLKGLSDQYPVEIAVSDDGEGMAAEDLSRALTFGGSGRFGDRSSFGRYGMGLPNAALSCARRVDVYSWRSRRRTLVSTLDLDEMTPSLTYCLQLRRSPIVLRSQRVTFTARWFISACATDWNIGGPPRSPESSRSHWVAPTVTSSKEE